MPRESQGKRSGEADDSSRARARGFALSFLLASIAGAASAAPSAEIINGTPTSDYPAVAAIVHPDGYQWCSASLIAPGCLLTAAHCVEGLDAFFTAYFGSDIGAPALAEVNLHGTASIHPSYDDSFLYYDHAIVPLASNPAITPLGFGARPTSAQTVTIVGFGRDALNVFGVKREATVDVDSVMSNQIWTEGEVSNTCSGDSGGPYLMPSGDDVVVVGVTSFGDSNCNAFGVANTTDNVSSWIATTVAANCIATNEGNGVFFGGFEFGNLTGGWESPPLSTCEDRCGDFQEIAFCQCDDLCLKFGDCCENACALCGHCP